MSLDRRMRREQYPRIKGGSRGTETNTVARGAPKRPGYQRPESPQDRKARLRRIASR